MTRDYSLTAAVIGLLFVALGALFLLDAVEAIQLRAGVVLPLVLIGAGLGVLAGAVRRGA